MSTTTEPGTIRRSVFASPAVNRAMDQMICGPTLRIETNGVMRAAFAPDLIMFDYGDDPWMTVTGVTHIEALGLVMLSLEEGDEILMTDEEYHSQV